VTFVVASLVLLQACTLSENDQLVNDLTLSRQRLTALVENTSDLIVRLDGNGRRLHRASVTELPDGAFVLRSDEPWLVLGGELLRWTPAGYDATRELPRNRTVEVLTPPGIVAALAAGYRPHWHPSADHAS